MEVTVYGDVLAAINFVVTLLLLRLTGRIIGQRPGKAARYISSLLGAVSAFAIFIPISSALLGLLYRLLVSVFLVGVGFPRLKGLLLLKAIGIFYLVSFLTAGAVSGILWIFPSSGFFSANGVVYFNIHPLLLITAVGAAYLAIDLFDRFNAKRNPPSELFTLCMKRHGKSLSLDALADTGNRLTEPFSGLPVIVVAQREAWPLLTEEERCLLLNPELGSTVPGLRWVLCRTVGEENLLPAFKPDVLEVMESGKKLPLEAYFAVTEQELSEEGEYSAVFNPKMIQVLLR